MVGSTDEVVPEGDFGDSPQPQPPPQQMAALQIQRLEGEMTAADSATRGWVVATQDEARRVDTSARVMAVVGRPQPRSPHPPRWEIR